MLAPSPRGALVVAHGIGMGKSFSFAPAQVALVRQLVDSGLSVLAIDPLAASMGAVASIAAAAEEPAVGAVVADSAYADFGVMLWRNCLRRTPWRVGRVLLPGTLLVGRWLLGACMHRFSPVVLAERLRGRPVLLVHAEGDRMVPAGHCAWLASAAQAAHWVTPGGSHLSSLADQPDAYRECVFAFLDADLPQPMPSVQPEPARQTNAPDAAGNASVSRQRHRALVAAFNAQRPQV